MMSGQNSRPAHEGLGPIALGQAEQWLWQILPQALPHIAAWTRRTIEALPPEFSKAPGYRDLYPDADGRFIWHFPHSNCAERIEAYLWLADYLHDDSYERCAEHYAHAMMDDPYWGIYQGPEEEGVGLVWYWRDSGLYMTNYAMRVPSAFLQLASRYRRPEYRRIAELVGRQLIRSQRPTGILREGWAPRELPAGMPRLAPQEQAKWLSDVKINSRIGYVCVAFADLWKATGEKCYLDALNHFAEPFERYQNPDGSFPEDIRTDCIEAFSPIKKGHFHHYILAGVARAATLVPEQPALKRIAERLGHFLLLQYRQSGSTPYGNIYSDSPAEEIIWRTHTPDSIPGLVWTAAITGDPAYREAASRIALQAVLSAFHAPDRPDLHGGIPVWLHPSAGKATPALGGFFHFWTILGLRALAETRA